MRFVPIGLVAVLITATCWHVWQATSRHAPRETDPCKANSWRRTTQGWQRKSTWETEDRESPNLHPAILATSQLLLCLLALTAFPSKRKEKEGVVIERKTQDIGMREPRRVGVRE